MESCFKINYNWSCDEGIEIPENHKEALKEDAQSRIFEMIKEGYFAGELSTSVRYGKDIVPEEDEDDGLNYSGWWSVNTETTITSKNYDIANEIGLLRKEFAVKLQNIEAKLLQD